MTTLSPQLSFDLGFQDPTEKAFGRIEIVPIRAKSILTSATGFIEDVAYSINPYRGCSHACTFCYAAAFSPTPEKKKTWGNWVEAKINASGLIQKLPALALHHKSIVMSSATDPYQPAEKTYRITRALLQALLPHQPQLIIQTHGPLVTTDIDLLQKFNRRTVNISITTDDEEIRREFEPGASSIQARLDAIKTLEQAGISTRITICPMLPIRNPEKFAQRMLDTGCQNFSAQYFHDILGDYRSSTKESVLPLLAKYRWSPEAYSSAFRKIEKVLHPLPIHEGDKSLRYSQLVKPMEDQKSRC